MNPEGHNVEFKLDYNGTVFICGAEPTVLECHGYAYSQPNLGIGEALSLMHYVVCLRKSATDGM